MYWLSQRMLKHKWRYNYMHVKIFIHVHVWQVHYFFFLFPRLDLWAWPPPVDELPGSGSASLNPPLQQKVLSLLHLQHPSWTWQGRYALQALVSLSPCPASFFWVFFDIATLKCWEWGYYYVQHNSVSVTYDFIFFPQARAVCLVLILLVRTRERRTELEDQRPPCYNLC